MYLLKRISSRFVNLPNSVGIGPVMSLLFSTYSMDKDNLYTALTKLVYEIQVYILLMHDMKNEPL